jgi:hypothetical protein
VAPGCWEGSTRNAGSELVRALYWARAGAPSKIAAVWNWFVFVASLLGFTQFGWVSARSQAWKDATVNKG